MNGLRIRIQNTTFQYLISLSLVSIFVVVCYLLLGIIDYKVVALVLLFLVSLLAMLFDIYPVLLTAVLSALIWNYFFIPPTLTFHIGTPEDALLFAMYFVIALINIVLTSRIKKYENKIREKDEREKAIRLYNTLLNSLSHELKTPISTIIGSIDTIKENEAKLSKTNISDLLNEMEIASMRLNRQVQNLLNMSRLEAGVLQPRPDWCDLNEIIFSVLSNNHDNAKGYKVEFEPKEDTPLVKVDRGFIEQVLNNIVHNAFQYSPEGTSVSINYYLSNSNCKFVISDSGMGIPEGETEAVFDKFYRIPTNSTGGTGLGLSIAKGFTEALNGVISLRNNQMGGAEFTIAVPVEVSTIKNELENE